jgi:hypothetical protein
VVHADAVVHEAAEVAAERRVEAEAPDGQLDGRLLLLGQHVDRHQVLRRLGGRRLGEVHQVGGGLAGRDQLGDGHVQRGLAVLEVEGYGPGRVAHQHGAPAGALGQ